jgi:hypothetical protein
MEFFEKQLRIVILGTNIVQDINVLCLNGSSDMRANQIQREKQNDMELITYSLRFSMPLKICYTSVGGGSMLGE